MPIASIEKALSNQWIASQFDSAPQIYYSNSTKQDIAFTRNALFQICENYRKTKSIALARQELALFLSLRWLYLKDSNITYAQCPSYFINALCVTIANSLYIDSDEAICQMLMPTVKKRLPNDGLTIKEGTETPETGLEPHKYFLTSKGNYVDIESFFSYAKVNSNYVLSEQQSESTSLNLFNLSDSEIGKLANVAGEKSKKFIAALYHQHLISHQKNHLLSRLRSLSRACHQASVEASGKELDAYLPACEKMIVHFYQFWMSLSQSQRDGVKDLKIEYGYNYPLESFLLCLFSGCKDITLSDENIERVKKEKILRCLQQLSNTIDEFCNRYTEKFSAITVEDEELKSDDAEEASLTERHEENLLQSETAAQGIIDNISCQTLPLSPRINKEDITVISTLYSALSSTDPQAISNIIGTITTFSTLALFIEVVAKSNIAINALQQNAIYEKALQLSHTENIYSQNDSTLKLLRALDDHINRAPELIPDFMLNDLISHNTPLSNLLKTLSSQQQKEFIDTVVAERVTLKADGDILTIIKSLNDDVWLDIVNSSLNKKIQAYCQLNAFNIEHLVIKCPATRRLSFINHANNIAWDMIESWNLNKLSQVLNDKEFEAVLSKPPVIKMLKEVTDSYIIKPSFLLETLSETRFAYLIINGVYQGKAIQKAVLESLDETFLTSLTTAYINLIKEEKYQTSSIEEALMVIKLVSTYQPDDLAMMQVKLGEFAEVSTEDEFIAVINFIRHPQKQKAFIEKNIALYNSIHVSRIVTSILDEDLRSDAFVRYLKGIPELTDSNLASFPDCFFENIEERPKCLEAIIDYVPPRYRLDFINMHPPLFNALLGNTDSLIAYFKRLSLQHRIHFLRLIISDSRFTGAWIEFDLANKLVQENIFQSSLTPLLECQLNFVQIDTFPDMPGKSHITDARRKYPDGNLFGIARYIILQYAEEYTSNPFEFFGHHHYQEIKQACHDATTLLDLTSRLLLLPQSTFTQEFNGYMKFLCDLQGESLLNFQESARRNLEDDISQELSVHEFSPLLSVKVI